MKLKPKNKASAVTAVLLAILGAIIASSTTPALAGYLMGAGLWALALTFAIGESEITINANREAQ